MEINKRYHRWVCVLMYICVCVWSIGALGIILLLLLCFKASGSDFIKLLQPESDRTEEKAEWVCDLPAALCTTVETWLINGALWVKGLTAGVTTRWLAHTPIQALFSLEMLMIYGSLNKSLKWKTFNGASMQVNDSSNGQCAELHVGSHGQNHKLCICCMLQWDTYSESGNPFIIWLLWLPCSLQHVMFDCSSIHWWPLPSKNW